jgi:hypothetical protein
MAQRFNPVVATFSKNAPGSHRRRSRTQRSIVEHRLPGLAGLMDSATVMTPAAFCAAIRTQLENSSGDEDVWDRHHRSLPSHPRTDLPMSPGSALGRRCAVARATVAGCAAVKIMMPLTRLPVAITALPWPGSDEIGLGLATRLPKTAIVYQCPECEARLRRENG